MTTICKGSLPKEYFFLKISLFVFLSIVLLGSSFSVRLDPSKHMKVLHYCWLLSVQGYSFSVGNLNSKCSRWCPTWEHQDISLENAIIRFHFLFILVWEIHGILLQNCKDLIPHVMTALRIIKFLNMTSGIMNVMKQFA